MRPSDDSGPGTAGAAVGRSGDGGLEKEAWLSGVLLENPAAGRLALVDSETAGYVVWAPPAQVPRAGGFPTAPVSADAVLLTALHVVAAHRGVGIGRSLVRAAAGDLSRAGIRAVEAFGWAGPPPASCLVPAGFLTAVGFREVAPHPLRPRLRLDVSTAVATRAEVEARLDRLRSVLRPLPRRRRAASGVPEPVPVPVRVRGARRIGC
jgi:GNAT superfamily N-acetyltransferase